MMEKSNEMSPCRKHWRVLFCIYYSISVDVMMTQGASTSGVELIYVQFSASGHSYSIWWTMSSPSFYLCGMKLFIGSQTSTVRPLKFGNGEIVLSRTLLDVWLLTNESNLIHISERGPRMIIRIERYTAIDSFQRFYDSMLHRCEADNNNGQFIMCMYPSDPCKQYAWRQFNTKTPMTNLHYRQVFNIRCSK